MNVLFLDQFSDLGGAQHCLLDLLPALLEDGGSACVAAPGNGLLLRRACLAGAETASIDCGPYHCGTKTSGDLVRFAGEVPRLARQISTLVERSRPDLIYVNGPRLLPAVAWLGVKPVLFHSHNYLPQRYASWLAGIALKRLDAHLVASCESISLPLARFVAKERMQVVYNGVGRCTVAHVPGRFPRVGVIGRIALEKGQAEFVQAARLVSRELPDCRFSILGAPLFRNQAAQDYFDKVREIASGLPVEFHGWRPEVYSALANLDLLVVPSSSAEATPRVILEAFAAGVPVLASRSGGISEIISQDETGYLVDSREPDVLGRKIIEILTGDPDRVAAVASRARRAWTENFTLERYQEQMLELMARAAGARIAVRT